jgi:multicomponent Na+:H+ antiporter subunit B
VENEVFSRYIEHGLEETGAVNIVAAVILDYRAFDTLGEIVVLFTALITAFLLLRDEHEVFASRLREQNKYEPEKDHILRSTASILIPCLLLFVVYVVTNGHLSAGGGFAGGAILGAVMVMYHIAFGMDKIRQFMNEKTFLRVTSGAVMFYGGVKGYSFFTGGNHLPSVIPLGEPGSIFSAGLMLPLNIAVGVAVACTVYGFFSLFYRGGF